MTICAWFRFLIAAIALAAVAGHPVRGRADDTPCRDLAQSIIDAGFSGIEPILRDTGEAILQEIKSRNYDIVDPSSPEGFVDWDSRNYQELYKFDFDSDGLDDFVYITNGGTALCTRPYFLKSDDKKQLVQVKGIDSSDLENEGKLCNNWGQSLSFFYIAGEVRAVTKDTEPRDTDPDPDLTVQGPVRVDFAVYKIGIAEETEPMCRVRMERRVK